MIARLGARELRAVDGGTPPEISSRVYPNKRLDAIAPQVTRGRSEDRADPELSGHRSGLFGQPEGDVTGAALADHPHGNRAIGRQIFGYPFEMLD